MRFKNIDLYFKSNCCNQEIERSPPCLTAPVNYFKELYLRHKQQLYAATITLGTRAMNSLTHAEQYKRIKKQIKKTYPYHGDDKYIFFFEFSKAGLLHAHGICTGYQGKFISGFVHLGKRNEHDESYKPINSINYFDYIQKDQEKREIWKFPPIHNIHRKDLARRGMRVGAGCAESRIPDGNYVSE